LNNSSSSRNNSNDDDNNSNNNNDHTAATMTTTTMTTVVMVMMMMMTTTTTTTTGSRFRALYGMYTVKLNEPKAIVKVNVQAGQSGTVNKISLESKAKDDDFQEVKRRKRHISNDTSQTAKKSTKSVPITTAVKQPPKAVLGRNFFAPLRTNEWTRRLLEQRTLY
jgi:hypothetical protein